MKGFSLLETIVAISILVLGILGPLAVATQALSRASITENEIIAYNLAEEGLEFIINKKESNSFSNISWLTGIDGSGGCHNANGCYVDALNGTITGCSSTCPFVKFDSSSGIYNNISVTDTIFIRRVLLEPVGSPPASDERRLRVIVSWSERFGPTRNVILTHHIFNN